MMICNNSFHNIFGDLLHFSLLILALKVLIVNGGLLVLLVFAHKVVHVGLGLSELHLVHALPSVPVEESLAPEHRSELLRNPLEQLLDGRGVANEGGGHFQPSWRDVTHRCLHIVRDPFNEVSRVLVLSVEHLLVHLLHRHSTTEHSRHCEVPSMPWIASRHHILGVKHLLGQFWHCEGPPC